MNTYFVIATASCLITALLLPLVRSVALKKGLYDLPDKTLKTHAVPTPRLAGLAMYTAIVLVLVITRFVTDYPTGTIRNLRYILLGSLIIFFLGACDDVKRGGLNFKLKFVFQFLAASVLLLAPITITFLTPAYIAAFLSVLWVVGITNSINLIDIQDGLAGSQTAIASAAFLAIGFPSEEIYVNILAAAIFGAILGFLPFNFSSKRKMFMGDAGSLTLGYFLAVLALGSSYSANNPYAIFAPLLILGVPLFETLFLIYIRLSQGLSPFKGSRDHTAHILKHASFTDNKILITMGGATFILSLIAFVITRMQNHPLVVLIYVVIIAELLVIARLLKGIKKKFLLNGSNEATK